MKLMNESGLLVDQMSQSKANQVIEFDQEALEAKFQERVEDLVRGYNGSGMGEALKKDVLTETIENKKHYQVSWFKQAYLIFIRSLINEFRNPLDVKSKFAQILFMGVISIALYCRVSFEYVKLFRIILAT